MRDGRATQAFERIDLLGHAHAPQLGGVARADAAGQDEAREHGTQLQDHRFGDDSAGHIERKLARELIAGLQAGHRPCEPGHQQHDEEAAVAHGDGLLDGAGDPDAPFQNAPDEVQEHKKEAPRVAGAAQRPPPHVSPQVEGGSKCSHERVSWLRMAPPSTPRKRKAFVDKLLAWYGKTARNLPWRTTRNPYAVLVSEFMLQQTQVSRVMEQWEGLGYYARARNLHKLAREVARAYDGTLPDRPEDLRTLPGVGPYTAGAVACFAYEKPVPAVDTNVRRVLQRVFATEDVWGLAAKLTPRNGKRAWRLNQAMMELGALVCTARKPKCPECPVRDNCRTFTTRPQTRRGPE